MTDTLKQASHDATLRLLEIDLALNDMTYQWVMYKQPTPLDVRTNLKCERSRLRIEQHGRIELMRQRKQEDTLLRRNNHLTVLTRLLTEAGHTTFLEQARHIVATGP